MKERTVGQEGRRTEEATAKAQMGPKGDRMALERRTGKEKGASKREKRGPRRGEEGEEGMKEDMKERWCPKERPRQLYVRTFLSYGRLQAHANANVTW